MPTRLLDTKSFERHKRMKEFTPSSKAKQKQLLGEESIHGRRKVEVMIAWVDYTKEHKAARTLFAKLRVGCKRVHIPFRLVM